MDSDQVENHNSNNSIDSDATLLKRWFDTVMSRLDEQEKAINAIKAQLVSFGPQEKEKSPSQPFQSGVETSNETPPPPPPPGQFVSAGGMQTKAKSPSFLNPFFMWIREDWLLKLGALLLLIGFGWLVSYAFLNNWIGASGRIAFGIASGALILLLGWWRANKFVNQGGVFLVLGSTTILLTIFAAREIYGLFTPFSALLIMFFSTAFVALASVKYSNRSLAMAGLILSGVVPLLTNSPDPNFIALFAYLFVVTLGAIWVVTITGWRALTFVALIIITLYSLQHFGSNLEETGTLLLFAYAFAGLFFITNTLGILKLKGKEIFPDLVTALGNGLFLLIWIITTAPDEWQSLILTAWMIIFTVGAFILSKITERAEPFYIYLGVGVGLLAAATASELNGAVLTIAYTVESGIIALISYYALSDIRIAQKTSLLLVGPVILSFVNIYSSAWNAGVIHKDFFVLAVLAITFLILGISFRQKKSEIRDKKRSDFSMAMFVIASIYIYIIIWLVLHAVLISDDLATMLSLIVYTIAGIGTYTYGRAQENRALNIYGSLLLAFVVGRLLIVDVWKMELTGRIITFLLIGALLMSTAFWGRKRPEPTIVDNNSEN